MTREDRLQELNRLRQKHPERLIAIYRSVTDTPERDQLPRGLGFTGMIEAILEHDVATGEVQEELRQAVQIASPVTNCSVAVAQRRARMIELRAFCGGGAIVATGLLLAVLYLLLAQQIPA